MLTQSAKFYSFTVSERIFLKHGHYTKTTNPSDCSLLQTCSDAKENDNCFDVFSVRDISSVTCERSGLSYDCYNQNLLNIWNGIHHEFHQK